MSEVYVRWEEKETDSGIQIAQGPTTVFRYGKVLSSHAFPMNQGGQIGFMVSLVVCRLDSSKIVVIDGLSATVVVPADIPQEG